MVNKIPNYLQHPIDDLFLKIIIKSNICNFFKYCNFTPNIITTFSLLFSIISIINLYYNKIILMILSLILSYIFDSIDGYYARKYKMCSKFGDYYDHFTDLVGYLGLFFIIYIKYSLIIFKNLFIIYGLIFLFILSVYNGVCVEIYYNRLDRIESFKYFIIIFKPLIKSRINTIKILKYSKYFGYPTLIIYIILSIIYLDNLE